MKDTYSSLEFDKIEEELNPYFAFEENISSFRDGELFTDPKLLEREHELLSETSSYLNKGYQMALLETQNLRNSLALLSKDGVLSIEALASFIPFLDNIKVFSSSLKDKSFLAELSNYALDLISFSNIEERLSQAILPDLSIADDASSSLFDIRSKIKKAQASIAESLKAASGKYNLFLASSQESLKGGLPALAIQAQYKNHVKGLVADISNSGSTVFIVPLEVLDIQNKIFELKEDERDEIARILKELSSELTENLASLVKDYEICLVLDSLFARVRFGNSYKGTIAENGDGLLLEDLAHPLLNPDTVITNTVTLGGEKAKILVISGPNAGGKTVLIKAVALACYMNQKGLLVCTRGRAVLPLFEKIIFISGDSQSIMDSLSTFSGHIAAIKEALDETDPFTLLVIDEIGQGTSPSDGEALGVSIIDYLKKIGNFTILTSHYDGIKTKAFSDPSCLIGAMVFDEQTIKPTFRYQEGMIGKSYALEVAGNMGLNQEVILGAQAYLKAKQNDEAAQGMEKILSLQQQNLKLKEEFEKKLAEEQALSEKRQRALASLNAEKESIRQKAQDRIDALVQEKNDEIEVAFRQKKLGLKEMAELKGQLKKITVDSEKNSLPVTQEKKESHVLQVGDIVRMVSMNNTGTLKSLDETHAVATVDVGGLSVKTNPADLVFVRSAASPKAKPALATADKYIEVTTSIPLECNLIGLRQDEAREKMDKYLDDCLLRHLHQVTIIHGNGTGALRNMVKNELKKNPEVVSYRLGIPGEGGVGVTVVTLK